jgi:hypothetical protein
MYWPYGSRWLKNPNILHLHMLIRQFSSSKILILGQNPRLWHSLYEHIGELERAITLGVKKISYQTVFRPILRAHVKLISPSAPNPPPPRQTIFFFYLFQGDHTLRKILSGNTT